jgi:hypothetical protein
VQNSLANFNNDLTSESCKLPYLQAFSYDERLLLLTCCVDANGIVAVVVCPEFTTISSKYLTTVISDIFGI